MTIREKQFLQEITIDLTGPQGNAFSLMGQANKFGSAMGMETWEIDQIIQEMKKGDYENLIQVFDNHFGHFCILER